MLILDNMKKKGVIISLVEPPISDGKELFDRMKKLFREEMIFKHVQGLEVAIKVGDVLVLSPATFGDPLKLEYGTVTHIKNPDTDDPNFQIRTDKHFWDFENFYTLLSVYRPIKYKMNRTELIKIV